MRSRRSGWKEFLEENYEITPEQFEKLSDYEKGIINREYDAYWEW